MSEVSETYNLRTTDQHTAFALLTAAGLRGFVYPPVNGWVTIVIDDWPGKVPPTLIAKNTCSLVRYLFVEDLGWQFTIWNGPQRVIHYECRWDEGVLAITDEQLAMSEVERFFSLDTGVLREILYPRTEDLSFPLPPLRFLEITGLPNCQWSSYNYLIEDYDKTDAEFAGILHVDGTISSARQVQGPATAISARLRKALWFPDSLRGDDATVRNVWSKIIRNAWKSGTWSDALSNLDYESAAEEVPNIISTPDRFGRPSGVGYWRPYWIGLLFDQVFLNDLGRPPEVRERFDSLVLEGLQYFWFALGILETDALFSSVTCGMQSVTRSPEERNCVYLEKYLLWLHELVTLRPLMWNDWSAIEVPSADDSVREHPSPSSGTVDAFALSHTFWVRNLLDLCYQSGRAKPTSGKAATLLELATKHRCDIIAMIMDLNLVRREGEEFVLI